MIAGLKPNSNADDIEYYEISSSFIPFVDFAIEVFLTYEKMQY